MMLIITVHVNAPAGQAIGIKEQIAQDLERYGDTRVVSVEVVQPTYGKCRLERLSASRAARGSKNRLG